MPSLYLFVGAAIGVWGPYAVLYLHQLGFSNIEVGTVLALGPLVTMLSQPLMGSLADRWGPARVLGWLLPTAAAAVLTLRPAGSALLLAGLGYTLVAATYGPVMPLTDSLCVAELRRRGGVYGRIRLWASIGFTVAVLAAGALYQLLGVAQLTVVVPLVLGATWVVLRHRFPSAGPLLPPRAERTGARELLRDPVYLLALAVVFALQMANSGWNAFFSIYLNELGATSSVVGMAWALASMAEIPAMYYVHRLLARFGPIRVLAIAALTYGLRYLLVSLAAGPGWALATQLLHSLSFGLMGPTLVLLAAELAPPHLQSTAQGLMAAVGYGVAAMAGSAVAGPIAEQWGIPVMFRSMALLAVLASAGFMAVHRWKEQRPAPVAVAPGAGPLRKE